MKSDARSTPYVITTQLNREANVTVHTFDEAHDATEFIQAVKAAGGLLLVDYGLGQHHPTRPIEATRQRPATPLS